MGRATFPENMDIRKISSHLAMRVIQQAIDEGLDVRNKRAIEAHQMGGDQALLEYIESKMWKPEYRPLVYLPPGRLE